MDSSGSEKKFCTNDERASQITVKHEEVIRKKKKEERRPFMTLSWTSSSLVCLWDSWCWSFS